MLPTLPVPKAVALVAEACAHLGLEFEILDPEYNYLFEIRGPGFRKPIIGGSSPINDVAAAKLAGDKYYASVLIERAGFRVPKTVRCLAPGRFHRPGYEERTGIEPALAFVADRGFPVIVKPNHASMGRGVVEADDIDEMRSALERIFGYDRIALVQEPIPTPDVRLDFLDGTFLVGYERIPARIVGDGERTVRALLADLDTRFAEGRKWPDAGLDPDTVPTAGEPITLGGMILNLNGFATAHVIRQIPDAWLESCLRIGDAVGLRHFGIDLRGASLDDPPERATVIEINASPLLGGIYELGWPEAALQAQVRVLKAMMRDRMRTMTL